jgi:hypothetical protein
MKTSDQELVICDMCPYCEEEVELYSTGLQECPRCGLHFTPSEEAIAFAHALVEKLKESK